MARFVPNLSYASLSDPGRMRLANEDALFCDPHIGLFVVCDGIGGQPSGEAASHIIAHSIRHLIKRKLKSLEAIDRDAVMKALLAVIKEMNAELYEHATACPPLVGMGATLVMTLIAGRTAYVAHAGDSRAYVLRDGKLSQITKDHTRDQQQYIEQDDGDLIDAGERRLLMHFIGRAGEVHPQVGFVSLEPGDRLLLCTDGLTDPVPARPIRKLLMEHESPTQACAALVHAALEAGGPDNVTLAVVDFHGMKKPDADPTPKPDVFTAPRGAAQQVHDALLSLEADMVWLLEGAGEAANESALSALAAVKRRVGHEIYRDFLEHHPTTKNPAHIFHQVVTKPGNPWREQYDRHIAQLEKPLTYITDGQVRLSAMFTPQETAMIFKTLWRDWRRVESRYFHVCQREALTGTEKTLNILIDHMQKSVRTLMGLFQFLPRYMRNVHDAPPAAKQ